MTPVSVSIKLTPQKGFLIYSLNDKRGGRERVVLLGVDYTVYHADPGFADLDNVEILGLNGKTLSGWKKQVVADWVSLELSQGDEMHQACWVKEFGE